MSKFVTCWLTASSVVLGIALEKKFQIYDKVSGKVSQIGARFKKEVEAPCEEDIKEEKEK